MVHVYSKRIVLFFLNKWFFYWDVAKQLLLRPPAAAISSTNLFINKGGTVPVLARRPQKTERLRVISFFSAVFSFLFKWFSHWDVAKQLFLRHLGIQSPLSLHQFVLFCRKVISGAILFFLMNWSFFHQVFWEQMMLKVHLGSFNGASRKMVHLDSSRSCC